MQRYVHCKLREFCKKASILKGCGTKKNTVRRVVCKDEPIKDERPRNYCKIDALHSHHSASVTSLFFVFFWFDWRKEEQNVRFYKKKQKKGINCVYTCGLSSSFKKKKTQQKKKYFSDVNCSGHLNCHHFCIPVPVKYYVFCFFVFFFNLPCDFFFSQLDLRKRGHTLSLARESLLDQTWR